MFPHGPESEPSTHDYAPHGPAPAGRPSSGPDTAAGTPATRAEPVTPRPALSALGDYDLLHVAGEGGMGVVYQARHRPTGRVVALKMLKPLAVATPELLLRFRREVRIADTLRHPHIAAVH